MLKQKSLSSILTGLLLFTVIIAPGVAQAAFLNGATPIGFWQLEETTAAPNVFDDISATDNDGTCSGANCPTQVGGQLNFGQSFPGGTNAITVPSNTAYNFSGGTFAIELWMSRSSVPGGNEVMVGRDDSSTALAWWVGVDSSGNAVFSLRDNNSVSKQISGYSNVADGSFHHIVAVRDGSQNLLYVDGVLEASAVVNYTGDFVSTAAVIIGANDTSGGFNFDGVIDELALFNNALSAQLVRQQYLNSAQGVAYNASVAAQLVADTTEAAVGAELFWTIDAIGNPLPTFALGSNAPSTMAIGATTGEISWIPKDTETGNTTFNITADNGTADTESFTINVLDMCSATYLVGFWQLEETTAAPNVFDDISATDNDGTCSGANCPTQVGGQLNFGQSFPGGTNAITIPSNTAYNFSGGSFAIEFWMSRSSVPGANEVMVGRDDSADPLAWWVGVDSSGNAVFSLRDNDGVSSQISGYSNVADGAFHHIVAVRDGGESKNLLYVDGVLEASASVNYTGDFVSSDPVYIGANDTSGGYNYDGVVDELAFYNRELTDVMVMQHAMLAQSYCNTAPVITSAAPTAATEDIELSHTFTATDTTDGDTSFTWTLTNAPSGMSVDASTGVLTWTPGEVTTSGTVTATVSDSVGGTDTQDFTIAVTNVNDAPVITTTAPTTATVGTEYSYDADATDDDTGDTLTWSKVSGPDALSIDSASGLVTWTPTDSDPETTNVTIMVSDGNGGSDTEDITITVSGGNVPGGGGGGGGGSCFIDSIIQ